jgi:hypothetical protein
MANNHNFKASPPFFVWSGRSGSCPRRYRYQPAHRPPTTEGKLPDAPGLPRFNTCGRRKRLSRKRPVPLKR